jgi:hypothetical protein
VSFGCNVTTIGHFSLSEVISKYYLGDQIKNNEVDGACGNLGDKRGAYTLLVEGALGERDQLEDLGVDGRIILRYIFKKWDVGALTGLIWLRIGTGGGLL